jgi:hypothetical protein
MRDLGEKSAAGRRAGWRFAGELRGRMSRGRLRVLLGGVTKSRVFDRIMSAHFPRVGVARRNPSAAELRLYPWRTRRLGLGLDLLRGQRGLDQVDIRCRFSVKTAEEITKPCSLPDDRTKCDRSGNELTRGCDFFGCRIKNFPSIGFRAFEELAWRPEWSSVGILADLPLIDPVLAKRHEKRQMDFSITHILIIHLTISNC